MHVNHFQNLVNAKTTKTDLISTSFFRLLLQTHRFHITKAIFWWRFKNVEHNIHRKTCSVLGTV